jgi:LmbE family N-acetylglucosaminyl deacetylase
VLALGLVGALSVSACSGATAPRSGLRDWNPAPASDPDGDQGRGLSAAAPSCAHRHEPQRLGLSLGPAQRGGARPFLTDPHVEQPVTLYPVDGPPTSAWHPARPLPPRDPRARGVLVVYTPHPDDETLSMGVVISNAVQRREQVVVVALTDGRTTRALQPVLTPDQVAAARDLELVKAVGALGVPAHDVVLAHLDAPGSACGAIVTVHEAEAVMRTVAARYPDAANVTMSYVAERNQDHLDAGVALSRLAAAHVIGHASWTVSRLWWTLPSPASAWVLPNTPISRSRVVAAALQYSVWEPAYGRYAVGWRSVPRQFQALLVDVRDKVHRLGPVLGPPTP